MTPYYEHAGITIYHGDCRELLPTLGKFDLHRFWQSLIRRILLASGSTHKEGLSWATMVSVRMRDAYWKQLIVVDDNSSRS